MQDVEQNQQVPMYDDQMNPVMVHANDVQHNLKAGFTLPDAGEVERYHNEQKYGGFGQQVKAAVEGGLEAATFGASTALERGAGIAKAEDIAGRRETTGHTVGSVAGLAASSFLPGLGEANILEHAGQAVASKLIPGASEVYGAAKAVKAAQEVGEGVEAAQAALKVAKEAQPFIAKIGTPAAEQLVQNGLFQAGDEVSKMFSGAPGYEDPGTAAQTAITNIGLASVLGGAVGGGFGAVSPLWKATFGQKTENLLNAIKNRADGVTIPVAKDLETLMGDTAIPAEMRAGMSDNPMMKEHYQSLIESGTEPGLALRETADKFKEQVGDKLKGIFDSGEGLTAFESGEKAKESIMNKVEGLHSNIREQYDAINPANESIQIPDAARLKEYDSMIKAGQDFGAVGGPASQLFKTYGERLLAQDTIAQTDKLMTEIGSEWSVARRAGDFEKARALGDIRESIRNFQDNEIGAAASRAAKGAAKTSVEEAEQVGKQLIGERQAARKSYSEFMDQVGEIAGMGKLGKVKSFGQLQEALDKIPSAKLAEKLFDKKNIESLKYLKSEFPDVFEGLVKQQKASLLEKSTKAGDLMHNQLLTKVRDLPKEVRELMFRPEELGQIEAAGKFLRSSNIRMGPSGTPRSLDTLWKHMPAGVGGIISVLTGHNPIMGLLVGEAGKFLSRDAPDAVKLSLLKFLGSTGAVDGEAWKVASDFIQHTYKGQKIIQNATSNVFKAGKVVLPPTLVPDDKSRAKLDKKLKELQLDQRPFENIGGKTGHYLPDHAGAMSQAAASATMYINSLRPNLQKQNPLDSDPKPSKQQTAEFNRALDIAEQPLVVVSDIKDGTILPQDVMHLAKMYPALYSQLKQNLMNNVIESQHDEDPIPYKTRLGLSIFMGQPLDSTMTPQAIMALNAPQGAPQAQNQMQPHGRPHSSMKDMGKLATNQMTPDQARSVQKQS